MLTKPCEKFRQGQSACPFPCAITLACLSCVYAVYIADVQHVLFAYADEHRWQTTHLHIYQFRDSLQTYLQLHRFFPPVKPQLAVVAVRLDIHYLVGRQPEQVLRGVLYDYQL